LPVLKPTDDHETIIILIKEGIDKMLKENQGSTAPRDEQAGEGQIDLSRESELETSIQRLEELNAALKSLLKHRDQDKRDMEERFLSNVKELVLPYIQKLKETELVGLQATFVEIAESNLNDITSPFLQKITSRYRNFTPKEIQVASLIKEGKRTKEIAQILGISKSAIDLHRNSIRNKLGLINKKTNLRSYLMSLF
jgi:DNA-binding CsgD family transcriptional regulator